MTSLSSAPVKACDSFEASSSSLMLKSSSVITSFFPIFAFVVGTDAAAGFFIVGAGGVLAFVLSVFYTLCFDFCY